MRWNWGPAAERRRRVTGLVLVLLSLGLLVTGAVLWSAEARAQAEGPAQVAPREKKQPGARAAPQAPPPPADAGEGRKDAGQAGARPAPAEPPRPRPRPRPAPTPKKPESESTAVTTIALQMPEPKWTPISVGQLEASLHQIALRGPLVAVPSNGSTIEGQKQPPGVFVVDGASGVLRFFARAPEGAQTLGVALDSDALVFAVNPPKGEAVVARLGLDGAYQWRQPLGDGTRVLTPPALFRAPGAGDVSVLFRSKDTTFLARLDGATGLPLWRSAIKGCTGIARQYVGEIDSSAGTDILVWCAAAETAQVSMVAAADGSFRKLDAGRSAIKSAFSSAPWLGRWQPELAPSAAAPYTFIGFTGSQVVALNPLAAAGEDTAGRPGKVPTLSALVDLPESAPCLLQQQRSLATCLLPQTGKTLGDPKQDAEQNAALPVFELGRASPSGYVDVRGGLDAFAFSFEASSGSPPTRETWVLSSRGVIGRVTFPDESAQSTPQGCAEGTRICLEQASLGAIDTASVGDVDADERWDLVAVIDKKLTAYSLNTKSRALGRHPLGDVRLSNVAPESFETPKDYAASTLPSDRAAPDVSEPRINDAFEFTNIGVKGVPDPFEVQFREREGTSVTAFGSPPLAASSITAKRGICRIKEAFLICDAPDGFATDAKDKAGDGELVGPIRSEASAGGQRAFATSGLAVLCPSTTAPGVANCKRLASGDNLLPLVAMSEGKVWVARENGSVGAYDSREAVALDASHTLQAGSAEDPARVLVAGHDGLAVGLKSDTILYPFDSDQGPVRAGVRVDKLQPCGSRWYALSGGVLLEADEAFRFTRVTEQPKQIRSLGCDNNEKLTGVALYRGSFTAALPPQGIFSGGLWFSAGLLVVAVVLLLVRRRVPGRKPDEPEVSTDGKKGKPRMTGSVKRFFDVDVPHADIDTATERQRTLVEALKAFIDNEHTAPPLTLGIYGAWGSGKSSIMQMLQSELEGTKRYVSVWFNAWRHHSEEHLGPALLQNIVRCFRQQVPPTARFHVWRSSLLAHRSTGYWLFASLLLCALAVGAWTLELTWTSLAASAAALTSLYKGSLMPFLKLFAIEPLQAVDKDASKRMNFLQEFSQEFERVTAALPPNHYVVVFVDDLDRCPPDRVVSVLETLNRLMESRHCYVVLGIDVETVKHCINLRYKDLIAELKPERDFGAMFLEKLITIGVRVPPVEPTEVQERRAPAARRRRKLWSDWVMRRFDQVFVGAALLLFGGGGAFWSVTHPDDFAALVKSTQLLVRSLGEEPQASSEAAQTAKDPSVQSALPDSKTTAPATTAALGTTGATPSPPATDKPPHPAPPTELTGNPRVLQAPPAAAAPIVLPKLSVEPSALTLAQQNARASSQSQALTLTVAGGAFLLLMFALFLFAHEAQKLLKEPPATDSDDFARELEAALVGLSTNPRQLVRFKNLARLTFHMVNAGKPSDASIGWVRDFFGKLAAAFKGASYTVSPENAWVEAELSRWLRGVSERSLGEADERRVSARVEIDPAARQSQG